MGSPTLNPVCLLAQDPVDVLRMAWRKMKVGGLTSVALLCVGCVSTAQPAEHANVERPLPEEAWSAVIRPMPMSPDTVKNVDNLTVADAPALFAGYVKDALALKQPAWEIKISDQEGAAQDPDLTITTELVEIEGGSAALRFWIGANTGASLSRVRVSVLDKAGTDMASAEISASTECPAGACTGSNEATVQRNLKKLAEEVVEFVVDPEGYDKRKRSKAKP